MSNVKWATVADSAARERAIITRVDCPIKVDDREEGMDALLLHASGTLVTPPLVSVFDKKRGRGASPILADASPENPCTDSGWGEGGGRRIRSGWQND